jgi:two-component system chemotaxis response regulator CheB
VVSTRADELDGTSGGYAGPVTGVENAGCGHRVLAVAASAGGIAALRTLLAELPAGFPMPVLIVQHLSPKYPTSVAQVLGRSSALPVRLAEDGERIEPGVVYVAPPGRHLLAASDGTVRLADTEPVNYVRPSADRLFASVAAVYGSGAIACVLTGAGRDGSAGAAAIKQHGGTVLVEDPDTAAVRGMPDAAVSRCEPDAILPLEVLAGEIGRRVAA